MKVSTVPMENPDQRAQETTLIFCCSGAADVGEIAHRAAKALDEDGYGMRFCLAGVGGRVPAHLAKCHAAQTILAIDGCRVGCSQRTLAQAGFTQIRHLCASDVGLAKGTSPVTSANVGRVVRAAVALLTSPLQRLPARSATPKRDGRRRP